MKRKILLIGLGMMLIGTSYTMASAREESEVNTGRRALELSVGLEWAKEESSSGEVQTSDTVEILYVEIQPGRDEQNAVTMTGNQNIGNLTNDNQPNTVPAGVEQQANGQQMENPEGDLPDDLNADNSSDGSSDNDSNSTDISSDNNVSLPNGDFSEGDNDSSDGNTSEGSNQPNEGSDNQEVIENPPESPEVSGGDL